jgi:hypothetical protein
LLITGVWLVFFSRHWANGSQAIGAFKAMFADIQTGDYNLVEPRLIFG